jgi:hypothetical protein
MTEYSKAFLIGGWSEDHDFLTGLCREVTEGPNRFVDGIEPLTLAEALDSTDKINRESEHRLVIAHSAGMMAIHTAGIIVALNGAEPTSLAGAIAGGIKVGANKSIGHESHVAESTVVNGVREVVRHPVTLSIPFRLRNYSTVWTLIEGKTAFPGGRVYLPTDRDEFGFGSHGEVGLARCHGIVAAMLAGWHNQPLLHPRASAAHIKSALEATS